MSGPVIALFGFCAMLVLIGLRMPVGLAMLAVGTAGYVHFTDWGTFLNYMKATPYHLFANYTLSVIPLFILMGALAERSGLSTDLFRSASRAFGRRPGGLAMAVIGASTAFGAICGSSVATTATFGRAALPELKRYGYDGGLSTATIAVGGTLGILVPPSVILIVYAISTEQNIVKLFLAALIPGLIAAAFYCIVIAVVVARNPALAPPVDAALDQHTKPAAVWPAILIAIVVVGGIYGGVFTVTEGASVGAVSMLLLGLARGRLGLTDIRDSLLQTAETTAMIFAILLGAEVFNAFLALSQLPAVAAETVAATGLAPYVILAAILAIYILLGAVMDELAMILLTLPVFFPVIQGLDFGLKGDETAIWFGILLLMVVGIGLTCPPIGLNVFVIHAMARDIPLSQTYRAVLPFIAADVFRIVLVAAFPPLALWLVRVFG